MKTIPSPFFRMITESLPEVRLYLLSLMAIKMRFRKNQTEFSGSVVLCGIIPNKLIWGDYMTETYDFDRIWP